MIWVLAALSLLALPGVRGKCGGKYLRDGSGPMDVIMSPGYADGDNYEDGTYCKFIFTSDNYQLSFFINCPDGQFDMLGKEGCNRGDRMRVMDGLTLADNYCGTNGPQMVMSGRPYLRVTFRSNNDGMTAAGFNCTVGTIVDTSLVTEAPALRHAAAQNLAPEAADSRVFVPPQGYKCTCGETNTGRVAGGYSPNTMSHPWLAAVQPIGETIPSCAGVIIDNTHILTSKSCASIPDIQVRLAAHDLGSVSQTITRNVSVVGTSGDLSILAMTYPINLSGKLLVRPICLPNGSTDFTSLEGTVAGWGTTNATVDFSLDLQEVQVTITDDCTPDDTLCAEDEDGLGLGVRDSGSPLVVEYKGKMVLAGVTTSRDSFTDPIVFTDVQEELSWINSKTTSATSCRN